MNDDPPIKSYHDNSFDSDHEIMAAMHLKFESHNFVLMTYHEKEINPPYRNVKNAIVYLY